MSVDEPGGRRARSAVHESQAAAVLRVITAENEALRQVEQAAATLRVLALVGDDIDVPAAAATLEQRLERLGEASVRRALRCTEVAGAFGDAEAGHRLAELIDLLGPDCRDELTAGRRELLATLRRCRDHARAALAALPTDGEDELLTTPLLDDLPPEQAEAVQEHLLRAMDAVAARDALQRAVPPAVVDFVR